MILRFKQHKSLWTKFILIFCVICLFSIPQNVQAYRSLPNQPAYAKLPGSVSSVQYYYAQINSQLGITNSGEFIQHAIYQWDFASWYTIFDTPNGTNPIPTSVNHHAIRAAQFGLTSINTMCGNVTSWSPSVYAATCPGDVLIILNATNRLIWNTQGLHAVLPWSVACSCYPIQTDLQDIMVHELGHIWGLDHTVAATPSVSVMPQGVYDPNIYEDDKRGATSYYGPNTSFENSVTLSWFPGHNYAEALGHDTWAAYTNNVASTALQIAPAQLGVVPYSGSQMRKIYGTAINSGAYAYFKLFSTSDDEVSSNFRYLKIATGMQLQWYQYNHAQNRMSIDILFTDGTVLRNSGLTDQHGVSVHPASRNYGTGVWHFFKVNLSPLNTSPLNGKIVKDIMIAYDNGVSGPTGIFRGYFDNLTISY